jgi:transcription initiation factor TFIIIB Brf1 subunit/transcription initiation factor TFIIB
MKADDVAKSQRALAHMNATLKEIKQVNEKLLARKKEFFYQNLKPKTWASNEITFVENFATKVEVIIRETEQIFLDVEYVVHQLQKRFNKSDVESSE